MFIFNHEQRGNLMFSDKCHLFVVMIFHILQERPYALCSKQPKAKKVAQDRQFNETSENYSKI